MVALRWRSSPQQGQPTPLKSESQPAERDFDEEILRASREVEVLKPQMAEALTRWLDATGPWAARFWERSIAEAVHENPDAVMALGEDDRRAVKEDAEGLIASARPHIQRRLVDDRTEDWPHLKPQTHPDDHAFRAHGTVGPFDVSRGSGSGVHKSGPEAVAGRLNGVLGDVASIFVNRGFTLTGFERGDPYGHKGQWHPDGEHKPEWSDEMVEAMAVYGALHSRYVAALAEGERLTAEKKDSDAADLWERA